MASSFFLENPVCAAKPNAAETWLLLRASGTEPLLRGVLRELLGGECGRCSEGGSGFLY